MYRPTSSQSVSNSVFVIGIACIALHGRHILLSVSASNSIIVIYRYRMYRTRSLYIGIHHLLHLIIPSRSEQGRTCKICWHCCFAPAISLLVRPARSLRLTKKHANTKQQSIVWILLRGSIVNSTYQVYRKNYPIYIYVFLPTNIWSYLLWSSVIEDRIMHPRHDSTI